MVRSKSNADLKAFRKARNQNKLLIRCSKRNYYDKKLEQHPHSRNFFKLAKDFNSSTIILANNTAPQNLNDHFAIIGYKISAKFPINKSYKPSFLYNDKTFAVLPTDKKRNGWCTNDGISGVAPNYFSVLKCDFLTNACNDSVQAGIFSEFLLKQQKFSLSFKKEQRVTETITVQLVYYHLWANVMKR